MARTIMIMAGGTGGHIYPGLAVAEEMVQRGWKVVWLGAQHGMETRIVPPFGYDIVQLSISGLRGKGMLRKFLFIGKLIQATVQAWRAVRKYQPDVVLGMGGYPSFPGGLVAILMRKPLLIHEQNAIAGLSNRILACWARQVFTGFPDAFTHAVDRPIFCAELRKHWLGNPVRTEISAVAETDKSQRTGPLRILVVGGSLGAAVLNDIVPQALAHIPLTQRPEVVHQAGAKQGDALRETYNTLGVHVDVREFITDMAECYAWCDLAITRAGALTLAELAAAAIPALLVPYPYAVDDHQTMNAQFLVEQGAAILIPQTQLNAQKLAKQITCLHRTELNTMAMRARAVAKPEATSAVAQYCQGIIL